MTRHSPPLFPAIGAPFALKSLQPMYSPLGYTTLARHRHQSTFDANRRAGRLLRECGLVSAQELTGVGEVRNAAAGTYIAAFIAAFTLTLVQLLRLLRWGRLIRPPF